MNTLAIVGICLSGSVVIQAVGFYVYSSRYKKAYNRNNSKKVIPEEGYVLPGNISASTKVLGVKSYRKLNRYFKRSQVADAYLNKNSANKTQIKEVKQTAIRIN